MRGILSEGMIMCATGADDVKPLTPPDGSVIGDKVRLQGYTGTALYSFLCSFVTSGKGKQLSFWL